MEKDFFQDRKIVILDLKTTEGGLNSEILFFAARTYINNEMVSKENFFIKNSKAIRGHVTRKNRITCKKLESEGVANLEALDDISLVFQDTMLFSHNVL